jgi:hypothetical protein
MWEMITDMIPRRRRGGMNTLTAMAVGAGVGIAAWEMMRRNNVVGQYGGDMAQMANSMMDAITN